MDIGFTGTQKGLTDAQRRVLDYELQLVHFFHHGDCIGADAEAHKIARRHGAYVILHPPKVQTKRAFCKADEERYPLPYLERNHCIVDESDRVIACPKNYTEMYYLIIHKLNRGEEKEIMIGSGTWATIRYARKKKKPLTIIFPDGTTQEENNDGTIW
jgi:hypothetical protein